MASFPFGLKMWYNIIICYKRKYSFSYKLKGTTCKILNVLEGRRERRNERSDHFLHSFVETVLESFWITRYMQIRFDLLTYFKTKIPTCYLALNFHLSPSISLSLSLSLSQIPFNNGLVKLTMNSSDQDFLFKFLPMLRNIIYYQPFR